jgi:hypothetical protein
MSSPKLTVVFVIGELYRKEARVGQGSGILSPVTKGRGSLGTQ